MTAQGPAPVVVLPVEGIGEVREGDDLAALVLAGSADVVEGDVLVVTSKVVSKAEGRVVRADRAAMVAGETDRVVARRGDTLIVRNRLGLTMAAAGVDASNTEPGTVVLLPLDPDASARRLRERLLALTGVNVAVVVSDTSGRAWREGQTDVAVGAAGIEVLDDHAGRLDRHGNRLSVTAPALADEIAGAGDLVKGKLRGCPVAVVRGLGARVLPPDEHGPGAATLVRPEESDMFGHGAREAVVAALLREERGRRGFGRPAAGEAVLEAVRQVTPGCSGTLEGADRVRVAVPELSAEDVAAAVERLGTVAFAHGWTTEVVDGPARVVTLRAAHATP